MVGRSAMSDSADTVNSGQGQASGGQASGGKWQEDAADDVLLEGQQRDQLQ